VKRVLSASGRVRNILDCCQLLDWVTFDITNSESVSQEAVRALAALTDYVSGMLQYCRERKGNIARRTFHAG